MSGRRTLCVLTSTIYGAAMSRNNSRHGSSEHELYLKLFITNGGGW
ncbi:MAG: hypothetical protein JNL96_24435 [Planctomycetaceae bacterium]|nr:hypothetical protein [Planctomycetaceae bacterium]